MNSGKDDVRVALASDANYAMPLGVTIRSIGETFDRDRRLEVYVLDSGISRRDRRRIVSSVAEFRNISVSFIHVDPQKIRGLKSYGWITKAAYARLLLPELLPTFAKVLYLDCDLIVTSNLAELWEVDFRPGVAAAAYDAGGPFVNRRFAEILPNFGIPREQRLFNSGVMLMDLERWREEELATQIIATLQRYPDHLATDQDGINAVLWNRITPLDIRWNLQGEAWGPSPHLTNEELDSCLHDYRIIHYSNRAKPWLRNCDHPLSWQWHEVKLRSPFASDALRMAKQPSQLRRILRPAKRTLRRLLPNQ